MVDNSKMEKVRETEYSKVGFKSIAEVGKVILFFLFIIFYRNFGKEKAK
jgi:hypothetical protein